MKKALKTVGWIVLTVFVLSSFYLLWQQSQPEPEIYTIINPANRDIIKQTVATGSIEPRTKVELKPQITGTVAELKVKAGDHVNAGDIVAVIKVIPDMSQLNQAQNKVQSELISLAQVEKEAARSQALYKRGVVSREENEQYQSKLAKARDAVQAARSQVEVITKGSSCRSGSVSTTVVRSNMNGTVLRVPVKVGTSVSGASQFSQGTTIAEVGNMNDVIFDGNIDETEVAQLQVGMNISLTPGAMEDVKIPATLEYISPEGQMTDGAKMFEIKAAARIPNGVTIRSGYSANATIILAKASNVISVDETCISYENGKPYVYKLTSHADDIKNQKFERIEVKLGISDGRYVQIFSGVTKDMHLRGIQKN